MHALSARSLIGHARILAQGGCLALGLLATPATAQWTPGAGWNANANVALVSDYRFRGISLSNRHVEPQGGIDFDTDAGFIVGIWASPVADTGGARTEVDIYGGYKRKLLGFDLSASAYSYLYPGGHDVNYLELQASAQHDVGPVRLGILAAYAPRQRNVIGIDDVYLQANMVVPIGQGPFSIRTAVGYEDGFYDAKWDWDASVRFEHKGATASFGVVGSTEGVGTPSGINGKPAVVAGLSFGF